MYQIKYAAEIYGFAPKISDFDILWFVILQYFFGAKIGYIRFWQENTKFIRLRSIEFPYGKNIR